MLWQFQIHAYPCVSEDEPEKGRPRDCPFALAAAGAYSSWSHFDTTPPMAPPTMGATQNSQSEPQASAPPKIAVAVERAGLSEAFDTGIATRWNRVNASPIAIGAKPAGQFLWVVPRMTIRNSAVMTISISATETNNECVPPYRLEMSVKLFHLPPAAPPRMT